MEPVEPRMASFFTQPFSQIPLSKVFGRGSDVCTERLDGFAERTDFWHDVRLDDLPHGHIEILRWDSNAGLPAGRRWWVRFGSAIGRIQGEQRAEQQENRPNAFAGSVNPEPGTSCDKLTRARE
jgi:hypothetical protein